MLNTILSSQTVASTNQVLNNSSNNNCIAKIDSGATHNYIKKDHNHLLQNTTILHNGPIAYLPDKTTIKADRQGVLPLHPDLSISAKMTYSFPNLTNESLISVGQLCDDNCKVIFDKTSVQVSKNNKIILQGQRSTKDKLYDINLNPGQTTRIGMKPSNHAINYIIRQDKTKTDLARYLHACAFSPSLSTFIKAINNGNFVTWPGIKNLNFSKLIGNTTAIAKGHLDNERKNLQSTKMSCETNDDFFPQKTDHKTQEHFITITDVKKFVTHSGKAYMDLTGKFPYMSSRGNQYLLVMYDFDSNAIVVEPLKSRQAKQIYNAFQLCEQKISNGACKPKIYILDNECAGDLKLSILKNNQKYELVPPHQHRRNAAERAIRTFKNHFLAGLASCDHNFPIAEWDRLLPQCEMTLNLLRNSRINNKLSAHAFINGIHDFNKSPLAPPGTKVVVHSKPAKRASWAFHGVEGWYIGPSPEHYRCVKCYLPSTKSEVSCDTVSFIPSYVPIPETTIDDHIKKTMHDLVQLLYSKTHLFPGQTSTTSKQALIKIAQLLNRDSTIIQPIPKSTSEGGSIPDPPYPVSTTNGMRQQTKKVPQMSHEESDKLIREIKNPKQEYPKPNTIQCNRKPIPVQTYRVPTPKNATTTSLPPEPHHPVTRALGTPRVQMYSYDAPSKHMAARSLLAQNLIQKINHIFDTKGKPMSLDALLHGQHAHIWEKSTANELGRLAQGIAGIKGNDAIDFIPKHKVPKNKLVTYARMVCDYRPFKSEPYRVRLTVGGDRLSYDDDTASPASSLL